MSNLAMMMGLGSGAGGAITIADVFSTYLYTGTGSAQTITNGIDLDSEGGAVIFKSRTTTEDWHTYDTERGVNKRIALNQTTAQYSGPATYGLTAFNSDGFSVGTTGAVNGSGINLASWTFRKAPKFFDVVTYTGDGVAGREIAHNLGCEVGCIIVKNLDDVRNWSVYHRAMDATAPQDWYMYLNLTNARANADGFWYDTAPTTTHFTVGSTSFVNGSGKRYVAYLFAHNEDLIQCGSYTGTGTAGTTIELGWKPQWVLIKNINTAASWNMFDTDRGWLDGVTTGDSKRLYADTSGTESNAAGQYITETGFYLNQNYTGINRSGDNYIYMAIKAED
jgi:hypothetical protein